MKRAVAKLLLAVGVFLAADTLRALFQNAISTKMLRDLESGVATLAFTVRGSFYLHIAAFVCVYFVAGVVVSLALRNRIEAFAVAFAVGLASPLSTLPFGTPAPFTWSTHAPAWLEVLYWANWYAPPLAALGGALAARLAHRSMPPPHAA